MRTESRVAGRTAGDIPDRYLPEREGALIKEIDSIPYSISITTLGMGSDCRLNVNVRILRNFFAAGADSPRPEVGEILQLIATNLLFRQTDSLYNDIQAGLDLLPV